MDANLRNSSASTPALAPSSTLRWVGVVFAMVFPAIITWFYFVFADRYSTGAKQTVYLVVKIIQFAFPAVWALLALREPLRTGHPTVRGLLLGVGFSLAVVAAGMTMFEFVLRGTAIFATAAELIQHKVAAFGVTSAGKYFALAGFYSLFHSLFEEYYWRWFVFRQLRHLMSLWPAAVLSAIAFTLHHIVVLSVFFKGETWLIALLAGGVAVGGVFWAWLYNRSDSLFDTWPSHLLVDAGLFFLGYELLQHTFAAPG